jgi:acyl-CoA reductase-like NAD-dependent aldehyde dehydrogenase
LIAIRCAPIKIKADCSSGGNDPCIVLPDVDIQKAAFNVALGGFFNSGQVCVATKRAFIHESIYESFIEALSGIAGNFKQGNPYEEGVMVGPIQNEMQYNKLKDFIADSKKFGHKFVAGTKEVAESEGYFIKPTVLDNPPTDSYIFSEEQFGPILPCQPWSDEEDVIRRANDTAAGLGATVYGNNKEQTYRIARQLQCGQVWINSFPKPAPQAHFGGHKQSGVGTENGTAGILTYANIKSIYLYKTNAVAKL